MYPTGRPSSSATRWACGGLLALKNASGVAAWNTDGKPDCGDHMIVSSAASAAASRSRATRMTNVSPAGAGLAGSSGGGLGDETSASVTRTSWQSRRPRTLPDVSTTAPGAPAPPPPALFGPGFVADPYPAYAELRRSAPVHRTELPSRVT